MFTVAIAGLVLLIVVIWIICICNAIMKLCSLKEEGWSGMWGQLKRRHDLVGSLVKCVTGYMVHERGALNEVIRHRANSRRAKTVHESIVAESGLVGALGRLFAAMENYPDLKNNANLLDLQNTLENLERELQIARRYYNSTVRDLNIFIQTFPANMVARQFGFAEAEYFELNNTVEEASSAGL